MSNHHFLVMPLDARPVCYDQILDLAQIGNLRVELPPPNLLGVLKQPAPFETLWNWWSETLSKYPDIPTIFSLDTITYGGLIASRVNEDPIDILEARLNTFLGEFKNSHRPRYAFSSILRIPDYNNAEEEPSYWAQYGTMLYQFSVETHQQGTMPDHMFNKIPGDVIKDFLIRRQKNFQANQLFLDLAADKTFDFLVICQDDTGQFGLTVKEADYFKSEIQKRKLQSRAIVQTGADEIAMVMLAKALWSKETKGLKVYPWFFPDHGKKVMARFDGIPIGNIVQRQIQTLGAAHCISPQEADLILMVNCPSDKMGDHCAPEPITQDKSHIIELVNALQTWLPQKNVAIADVVYANGGDPVLMNTCLEKNIPLEKLASYAGWNTPGNSIGSALAIGSVVAWAQQHGTYEEAAKKKLLFTRLIDDWYYQAEVRFQLRKQFQSCPPSDILNREMSVGSEQLKQALKLPKVAPTFSFPCNRLFEIAVHL